MFCLSQANVNIVDSSGMTALLYAVAQGSVEIVSQILAVRADLNACATEGDLAGNDAVSDSYLIGRTSSAGSRT